MQTPFPLRLQAVRRDFESAAFDAQRRMAWRAYLFAALSVRTPVAKHEAAFERIVRIYSDPKDVTTDDAYIIAQVIQQIGGAYAVQKSKHIAAAARILCERSFYDVFGRRDREARLHIARTLPGVGLAKASFMLMLLGHMETPCFDSHMATLLKLRYTALDTISEYERGERRLKKLALPGEPLGVAQWRIWSAKLGIESAHDVYFQSQELNTHAPIGDTT